MERMILKASEGMILTDGKGTYGKTIYLADNRETNEFYEITQKDYDKMLEESMVESEGYI